MTRAILFAAALLVFLAPGPAAAAPEGLDTSFNEPWGYVLTGLPMSASAEGRAAVRTPSGGFAVAGLLDTGVTWDVLAVRLLADGSPDPAFGDGGTASWDGGNTNEQAFGVAVQEDGRVLATGMAHHQDGTTDLILVRFLADGTLDASFGADGVAVLDAGGDDCGRDVLVQPDGKILVAGWGGVMYDPRMLLARWNSDGTPDLSFGGGDGVATWTGGWSMGFAAALQPDGRIVVAGARGSSGDPYVLVQRFTREGALETTFDGSSTFKGIARDVVQTADGKTLIAGDRFTGYGAAAFALRWTAAGGSEFAFNGDGYLGYAKAVWSPSKSLLAGGVRVQSDGGVIVSGEVMGTGGYEDLFAVRFSSTGVHDTAFAGDGVAEYAGAGRERAGGALPGDADGIIVVGTTTRANYDVILWSLSASGGTGPLGTDGSVLCDGTGVADDRPVQMAVQGDGRVVVAGTTYNGVTRVIVVARYLVDGSLDSAFGEGDGITVLAPGPSQEAYDMALQADGKVLVSGRTWDPAAQWTDSDVLVVRLNTDGTLDTSFDGDGVFTWNSGPWDYGTAVAQDPSAGTITVAGSTYIDTPNDADVLVLRLTSSGALDTTFSGDGVLTFGGARAQSAADAAVLAGGSVVLLGSAANASYYSDGVLWKVTSAGALDASFSGDGAVQISSGSNFTPGEVAVQAADGGIVWSGSRIPGSFLEALVGRVTSAGAIDGPFGGGGTGVFVHQGNPNASLRSVALGAEGRIVAAGAAESGEHLILVFTSAGILHGTFGGGDGVTSGPGEAKDVAISSDGRIWLAGALGLGASNADVMLARYWGDPHSLQALTLTVGGNGGGNVSSPPWLDCDGGSCSASWSNGTTVTLVADADPGSVFTGWTGDCAGSGECVLLMDQARAAGATFMSLGNNQLTVSASGSGTGLVTSDLGGIDCGSSCTAPYWLGSDVTLTATPATGSVLGSWTGCDFVDGDQCVVTMDGDRTVGVSFAISRTLTVTVTGPGSVDPDSGSLSWAGPIGTGSWPDGAVVALAAQGDPGFELDSWSGCDEVLADGRCRVTLGASRAVGASFAAARYTLTVTRAGSGTGTVTLAGGELAWEGSVGSASFGYGDSATLDAAPDPGSRFSGWSGFYDTVDGAQCSIPTFDSDRDLTATFSLITWPIVASAGHGGSISPAGTVEVPEGTNQAFEAVPDAGWDVHRLTVDGVPQGGTSSWEFTDVREAHAISAAFRLYDGFAGGLGKWFARVGAWRAVQGQLQSPAAGGGTLLVAADGAPDMAAFTSGRLQARIKLVRPAGALAPAAGFVFAWQNPQNYRYVRLAPGKVIVGQVGTVGGAAAGKARTVLDSRIVPGAFYLVTVDVLANGTVTVSLPKLKAGILASRRFPSGPVAGAAGLNATRPRALFDNFNLWQ